MTCVRDYNTHTHTETDKPIAVGEILQICLKMWSSLIISDTDRKDGMAAILDFFNFYQ